MGGGVTGTPGPPLATPLFDKHKYDLNWALLFQKNRLLWIHFNFFLNKYCNKVNCITFVFAEVTRKK